MLRLVEIALFLAPFVIFLAWRLAAPVGTLPTRTLAAIAIVVVVLFATLLWFRREGSLPADDAYVPAHLENGRVVPAHGVPR